jgi:hypothetical protein
MKNARQSLITKSEAMRQRWKPTHRLDYNSEVDFKEII